MATALVLVELLLIITITASENLPSGVLRVNNILSLYQTCLTDMIFLRQVSDIEPPTYPITIYSSSRANNSDSENSVRKGNGVCARSKRHEWGSGKVIPKYFCYDYNYFTSEITKNFKFNCVSLILIGVECRLDIRKTLRNYRNGWIHTTNYFPSLDSLIAEPDGAMKIPKSADTIHYYNNLFVNVVGLEDSKFLIKSPVWRFGERISYKRYVSVPTIYIWASSEMQDFNNKLTVSIIFNSPCVFKTKGLVIPNNSSISSFRKRLSSELKSNCQNLVWETALTYNVESYYGPPIHPTSRLYLEDSKWKTRPFELIILSVLVDVFSNISISMVKLPYDEKVHRQRLKKITTVFDVHSRIDYRTSGVESGGYFIPTESNGFRFLNCQLKEKSLSFRAYLMPYQSEAWITITVSIWLSTVFLTILFRFKNIPENGFLLIYSFLLEHGYHLSRRLTQMQAFNMFLTTFLLMGIVITNGYKGIVITDLTAPIQESRLRTFKEAVEQNFSVLGSIIDDFILGYRQEVKLAQELCLRLNSTKDNCSFHHRFVGKYVSYRKFLEEALETLTFSSAFLDYVKSYLKYMPRNVSNSYTEMLKSIYFRAKTFSEDRTLSIIENGTDAEFLKCNKTIFVDNVDTLKVLHGKLQFRIDPSLHTLYMVEDEIGESCNVWHMDSIQWANDLLSIRMNSIFSSGIYGRWNDFKRLKSITSSENANKRLDISKAPQKLGLSSNIISVFVIYLFLVALIPVVFIWENQKVIIKGLRHFKQKKLTRVKTKALLFIRLNKM